MYEFLYKERCLQTPALPAELWGSAEIRLNTTGLTYSY